MKRSILLFILLLQLPHLSHGQSITNSSISLSQTDPVKNVIILIGDGMGFEHLKYASYVEYGIEDGLFMQSDNFIQTEAEVASSHTAAPDSASSGTSIASGVKTKIGYIGVDADGIPAPTILEYAESLNKSSGLVTSVRFNHATPAVFAAHTDDRDDTTTINQQMMDSDVDVILGGGTGGFISMDRNSTLEAYGYTHIADKTSLDNLNLTGVDKLFGTFTPVELEYEAYMNYSTGVRLSDLVPPTLELLSKNPNGFFLMIESGLIDKAGHEMDTTGNVLETIEFDKVTKMVYDWVQLNPDTLLLGTADHETGALIVNSADGLDSTLPNPADSDDDKRSTRVTRIGQIDGGFRTSSHMAFNVPFFGTGKNSANLVNTTCEYSNANIFGIMKNAYDGIIPTECPEYIPGFGHGTSTSSSTTSSPSSTSDTSSSTSSQMSTSSTTTTPSSQTSNNDDSPLSFLAIPIVLLVSSIMVRRFRKQS
jgi:alkaline phosphatase